MDPAKRGCLLVLGAFGVLAVLVLAGLVYHGPIKNSQIRMMDVPGLEEVAFSSIEEEEWSYSHRHLARERLCEMWLEEAQDASSWEKEYAAYQRGQRVGSWCREGTHTDLLEKVIVHCSTVEQCVTALAIAEEEDRDNLEWLATERWKKFWLVEVHKAFNVQDLLALAKECPYDPDSGSCDRAVAKALPMITTAEQAYDLRWEASNPDLRDTLRVRRCELVSVTNYVTLAELDGLHRGIVEECPDKAQEVAKLIERQCLSFVKRQHSYTALAEARLRCRGTSTVPQINDLIGREIVRQVRLAANLQEALAVLEDLHYVDIDTGREAISHRLYLDTASQ